MSDKIRAVLFVWTEDGVMKPLSRFATLCDRQYVVGEEYGLAPVEQVSHGSRGGFFAELRDIYDSLPEIDNRYPDIDYFRARALVAAGWAVHTQTVFDTKKDAMKNARSVRRHDVYAVIRVSEAVVDVWVAKSIAGGQITAEKWKDVKEKALHWARQQVGVSKAESQQHMESGGSI